MPAKTRARQRRTEELIRQITTVGPISGTALRASVEYWEAAIEPAQRAAQESDHLTGADLAVTITV